MTYLSGFHAIEERIKAGRLQGAALLVAKPGPRARELTVLATANRIPVNRVGTHELDRLVPGHRGVALELEEDAGSRFAVETTVEDFLGGLDENRRDALVVILDEVTDPHNYGAILRSCDQFGVDLLVTRRRRIAKYADVIAKTSAGAFAWVASAETPNLKRAVDLLKEQGFWVFGADMDGEAAYTKDLRGRVALILGGEGDGISRLLRESCDGFIAVPTRGRIDSLNVSVAAGILFYEVIRQRGTAG